MLRNFLVYVFALLMITVSGCSEFAGDDSAQPDSSSLVRSRNVSKLPEKPVTSSKQSEIVEPNGVVTLQQALDFALANNPQLKAFSLDVRASHAKRLQATHQIQRRRFALHGRVGRDDHLAHLALFASLLKLIDGELVRPDSVQR